MIVIIVGIVFLCLLVGVIWKPALSFPITVCVFGFEQWAQANSAFFVNHSTLINLGTGVLVLSAVSSKLVQGQYPWTVAHKATLLLFALYTFAGFSCLWSIDSWISWTFFKHHLPYVIAYVGLMPLVLHDKEEWRFMFMATLVLGSICMLLLLFGTNIHEWGRQIVIAQGATLIDQGGVAKKKLSPLAVADMAAQIMIIATCLHYVGINKYWRILRFGVVLLALIVIFRSQSRGQLIGAVIAVALGVMLSRGTYRWKEIVVAVGSVSILSGVLAWTFLAYADLGGRWSLHTMTETFESTRVVMSAKLLTYWHESPPWRWLFGLGSSASYDPRIIGNYCHVVPIEALAELGIIGFAMYATCGIILIRAMVRMYGCAKESTLERGVASALISLMLFEFMISLKQGSLLGSIPLFQFGLITYGYYVLLNKQQKKMEQAKRAWQWAVYRQSLAAQQQQEPPLPHIA